jgi:rhamnogalacturonan endolyase
MARSFQRPALPWLALLAALSPRGAAPAAVTLTVDGAPAKLGSFGKTGSTTLTFDNGLLRFTLAAQGAGVDMREWLVGASLPNLANTTESSWYEDWDGGKNGNVAGVDTVRVLRLSDALVEVALADTQHPRRRLEQHIVMQAGLRGVVTYTAMTVVADGEALDEIRHNTRWDRCTLNYAFNHERPPSQQPTYPYLYTQKKIQDETWLVDGVNNPALPCPADNAGNADGNLPAGSVYTKYDWSLYHHENSFFGHWGEAASGQLVGVWLTPLGGVTNATSAATYGVGPQHQDLAIHQDDLILNYMGANHYGLPAYPVPKGYTRFYGPYLHHSTVGDATDPAAFFAAAAAAAEAQIALANVLHPAVQHPWYPSSRSNVTGRVAISDGRAAGGIWVVLSTQREADLFVVHEPTRFVLTLADGTFLVPGVPPGDYVLYLQAASGSITDLFVAPANVSVAAGQPVVDVGTVAWAPSDAGRALLWQIGEADRTGGEFGLAREPRDWALPGRVPGDLTFTVGQSAASAWFYAQTQAGTWTVAFELPAAQSGTAYLTVAASLTDGFTPSVAVNGIAGGLSGQLPQGEDSTLSRQAVRSGWPKVGTLSFDAARLVKGANTVTFSRAAAPGGSNNTGMGYDTVKLQVAPAEAWPAAAAAAAA